MSNFPLFLTRLLLYLDVLLVCGCGFPSISLQFYPAGLFFFLHIAIGRSFPLTWRRRNGVVALAFRLFKRHVLKEYWSRFKRLSIVFLSQQRVGYHILFPLPVDYVIGHILYFQCPPCLLPVNHLGLLGVGQILVIRNNLGLGLRSFEVLSPLLNSLNYCQHLLLGYGIILFCACHFL